MSTGLFLVRRLRICTTRASFIAAPDDGVQLAGARQLAVRSMPSWSSVGVRVLPVRAWLLALRNALVEDARRLGADLVQRYAQAFEHAGSDALALAHDANEQVFRADVVVAEAPGLVHGQLNDLLGARREADVSGGGALAATNDELDGGANLGQFHVEAAEDPRGNAVGLTNQTEEDMFRADVVVVEALRFLLSEGQHSTGTF